MMNTHGTRRITMHHTANANSNGTADLEANKAEVRAIHYYHAATKRWGDIGYNALVDAVATEFYGDLFYPLIGAMKTAVAIKMLPNFANTYALVSNVPVIDHSVSAECARSAFTVQPVRA